MNVSPYDGFVQFLVDKFGLSKSEAIKILNEEITRETTKELFSIYLNLRIYGYDFAPVKYTSERTLQNVLKILISIHREVVMNQNLEESVKRALLHVLRTLNLNVEIGREGLIVITDSVIKRLEELVRKFAQLFREIEKVMQVGEWDLVSIFERRAKEANATNGLKELKRHLDHAEGVLKRCKKLDVIKRIRETALSILESRKWYDEGIKKALIDIIRDSDRYLNSNVCTADTIVSIVIHGSSVAHPEKEPSDEPPEEILKPFILLIEEKTDLLGAIINRRRRSWTLKLIRLPDSKLEEIERGIRRIQNSLSVDLGTAPWEVLENAKRLDELEREVCSSLRESVEIELRNDLRTVLDIVESIDKLCQKIRPIVKVELIRVRE